MLVGNVFALLVCVCVKSDWSMWRPLSIYIPLIRNWLSLGKMNPKKHRESMRGERDTVADYSEASSYICCWDSGVQWWRGCELSANVKLSKWKSIMCVCVRLTSKKSKRTSASRAERWAKGWMKGMIQHVTDRSLVSRFNHPTTALWCGSCPRILQRALQNVYGRVWALKEVPACICIICLHIWTEARLVQSFFPPPAAGEIFRRSWLSSLSPVSICRIISSCWQLAQRWPG